MATAPIAPTASFGGNATANLRLDDLLRVLLTELTHQDPFKPVENKDFMSQIAQFATLNSSQELNQSISQLLTLQALSQTVGLIGREVSATTPEAGTVNGEVRAVEFVDGVPLLTIADKDTDRAVVRVPIGALQTIRP